MYNGLIIIIQKWGEEKLVKLKIDWNLDLNFQFADLIQSLSYIDLINK
jgi:hypothetical protein